MVTFPNAKINIGLQIIRKRPDNYHDLETVFYPLPLFDVLEIVKGEEFKLFVTGIDVGTNTEDNLGFKVYQLLAKDFEIPPVHVHLHKNIPVGAGLGGGSSDAAFLIKLMNDYFNLKMDSELMMNYARKIGADCAFFINNRPVFASGIGDRFSEIDIDLSAYHFVLIKPPIHINTALAFQWISPNENGFNLQDCIHQPIEMWRHVITNDFESAVFERYPVIEQIKDKLYQAGAIYAAMSGSGSSVFGIFNESVSLPELEKSNKVIYC